jgi:spore coat polysaccharide biosynthesis protein SpsF
MSKTLGIVHLGPPSEGLREKLSRKLGSHSLLELVIRRVTECQQLDGVAVVLGPEDAALAALVPANVPLHVSDRADSLGRFVSAAEAFEADAVVRVCAEHPFVDPVLIDRLAVTADAHRHCDYVGFCLQNGRPAGLSALGLFGEWCRTKALRRAEAEATSLADREQVTRYLWSHPEIFPLRFIPLPCELEREDLRSALNDDEAWEHAVTIYDAVGHEDVNWRRIAGLFGGLSNVRRPAAMEGGRVAPSAP